MTPPEKVSESIVVEALKQYAAFLIREGYNDDEPRKAIRLATLEHQGMELLRGIGERHRFDPKDFDSIYALLLAYDKAETQ